MCIVFGKPLIFQRGEGGILLSFIAKSMVLNKYATWQNKEVGMWSG